jgi:hypothetical protein
LGAKPGRRWEKKYIYKLTAVKKYKLTPHQIKQAIEQGIIKDHRYVTNPYYASRPPALLVDEEGLVKVLDLVKRLPKYSGEELARRRESARRSRVAAKAKFSCPLCGKEIRPRRDALAREGLLAGWLTHEEAKIIAIVAHFRHAHTDYDKVRNSDDGLRVYMTGREYYDFKSSLKAYEEAKSEGDRDLAEFYLDEVRGLKDRAIERMKGEFTRRAIELAKQHNLFPPDFTPEKYSQLVAKAKGEAVDEVTPRSQ